MEKAFTANRREIDQGLAPVSPTAVTTPAEDLFIQWLWGDTPNPTEIVLASQEKNKEA